MSIILGCFAITTVGGLILLLGVAAIAGIARSKKQGTSGSLGSAALEIQSLLEPEKKRVVETMRHEEEAEHEDDRLQSPPR